MATSEVTALDACSARNGHWLMVNPPSLWNEHVRLLKTRYRAVFEGIVECTWVEDPVSFHRSRYMILVRVLFRNWIPLADDKWGANLAWLLSWSWCLLWMGWWIGLWIFACDLLNRVILHIPACLLRWERMVLPLCGLRWRWRLNPLW